MEKNRLIDLFRILAPILTISLFCLAMWVLVKEFRTTSLTDILTQLNSIPLLFALAAVVLTAFDYIILTFYDFTALKYAGAKLKYSSVAPISFSAFAVGHNVGLASLSGGAIRYRAYSLAGLTASQIAIVIVFVSLTFGLGSATMLGIALLVESANALPALPLSALTLRLTGIALLLCTLAYFILICWRRAPLQIKNWQFSLPSPKLGLIQIVVSCIDIVITSSILFVLLSATIEINYFVFLGVYLLATGAGVISGVPGALGVFESVFFVLLPNVPTTELIAAIIGFRLCYYLLPLVVALIVIVLRELKEHRLQLQEVSEHTLEWGTKLIPQTIGVTVFLIGAYLVLGGSIPFTGSQLNVLQRLVPLPLLEMSHLLSSAVGMGLLIVARGLYRRLHRAYLVTILLLVVGAITLVIQTSSWLQSIFPLSIIGLLWLSRSEFYRGKRLLEQRYDLGWVFSIALVLLATLGLGLFANSHVEYSTELWWQFTFAGDASRMLRAGLMVTVIAAIFAIARLMQVGPDSALQVEMSAEELLRIKNLVKISHTSLANAALLGDKRFLYHPTGSAVLMYQESGRSWITLGDPLGNPQYFEELIWQYRELCDTNNVRCVFYQITDEYLSHYIDLGLSFSKLGEEATIDLTTFSLEGSARAELRQALSRAARAGAEFTVVPSAEVPAIIDQLRIVSDQWLKSKNAHEKGFSLGFFDEEYLANFDCAVVKVEGEIVAFSNLWPAAGLGELSLDLMRYSQSAPKGIMDYLFTQTMLWGAAQGYTSFSLGMAPLSGLEKRTLAPLWHKLGNFIYRFGENFYNFEGLRHYKEKYDPAWEPRFLACKGGLELPAVLLDTTTLISGGMKEIFFK